ncbi:MAG TPA: glycine zipper 2TM domain-containing protein [Caldimonas sp.]|nr:glycine zipper 2TM domain-containing protein [Caldimonas sp.]
MNRPALLVLLATAGAAFGAQAHTYTDNARVIDVEAQYENVTVPRQECRSEWVSEAQPARRNYGGVVVGGLAGALIGHQVGRGHGREAATAVGAVVGALTGDNIANRTRWEQPVEPAAREVTSCRTVSDVQPRLVGYRVDYEYRGQRFSTLMQDNPGAFVPVRVSVEPVGR